MLRFSRDVSRVFALAFAMLILQSGLSMAQTQVSVNLPNVVGMAPGDTVVLPITTSNLAGYNISAYQFTLSFDPTIVKVIGYDTTGTLSAGMSISLVTQHSGQAGVAAASVNSITGTGVLLKIDAVILKAGASALSLGNTLLFNTGTPTANSHDGSINGTSTVTVSVPAVGDSVGGTVMIPINTTSIVGQSVYSYQFTASYDPSVVQLTGSGYSTTGSLSASGLQITSSSAPGSITIAAAGSDTITGKGTLIYLTGKILKAGVSPLVLAGFLYNGGTPTTGVSYGTVSGVGAPVVASFSPNPTPTKIEKDSTVTFSVTVTPGAVIDSIVTYSWYVNNIRMAVGTSNSYKAVLSTNGNTTVMVVARDAYGLTVSQSWSFLVTGIQQLSGLPTKFALGQNYPNPFNPTTNISFDVPKAANVQIVIYDILGQQVRSLVDQYMMPGRYSETWDGLNNDGQQAVSGIYFYRMQAGNFVQMKKMVLLK